MSTLECPQEVEPNSRGEPLEQKGIATEKVEGKSWSEDADKCCTKLTYIEGKKRGMQTLYSSHGEIVDFPCNVPQYSN